MAERLQANREPDQPEPREVLNLQEPPVPLLRNAGAESPANLRAQREPADNDAPLIVDRPGILNSQGAVREINPGRKTENRHRRLRSNPWPALPPVFEISGRLPNAWKPDRKPPL